MRTYFFSYTKSSKLLSVILAGAVFAMPVVGHTALFDWLFGKKPTSAEVNKPTEEDHTGHDHGSVYERQVGTAYDFANWQIANPHKRGEVLAYERFLKANLGSEAPPLHELLTTARSWQACGHEPYEVPPRELWTNMLPTLQLYNRLKWQGILPNTTQIRSVYRNPTLNQCAGGATSSKHMINGAIDIWVPEYGDDSWQLYQMKDKLCQFWKTEGQAYNFGLGLYATGAIHIDTQGYRKWGLQYSLEGSPCREIIEKLYVDGQF